VHVGPPAYLGISVTDDGDAGAPVAGVVAGGPAAEAGLETGDRITAVDGAEVGEVAALLAALDQHEPGDSLELTWTHEGRERTGTATLEESPYA
jgi:S1-C subfamily serine protease